MVHINVFPSQKKIKVLVLCMLLAGLAFLLAVEWYFRFSRYQFWSMISTGSQTGEVIPASFVTIHIPAKTGGDLSALIGLRHVAVDYRELRPAGQVVRDSYGYYNSIDPAKEAPHVIVAGDSFLMTGTQDKQFATKLGIVSHCKTYNFALPGLGPFISIERFLVDRRFHDQTPAVLLWGFAEREVDGDYFERFSRRLKLLQHEPSSSSEPASAPASTAPRIDFRPLRPSQLKKSLPETSLLANLYRHVWNLGRYHLFGMVNPEVVFGDERCGVGPMLFFAHHVEVIRTPKHKRRPEAVASVIGELHDVLKTRGIELVVMLIPEKEQIYRECLPAKHHVDDDSSAQSVLGQVEQDLRRLGIPVINLLPEFRRETENGNRLYWRDDTHWNNEGIDVAVRLAALSLNSFLPEL